jgi:hypothetical protein
VAGTADFEYDSIPITHCAMLVVWRASGEAGTAYLEYNLKSNYTLCHFRDMPVVVYLDIFCHIKRMPP